MRTIKQTLVRALDPHLGHAYHSENDMVLHENEQLKDGVVILGDPENEELRIAVLGGSTTDPSYKGNWPRALFHIMKDEGYNPVIFNCGVSGYSTNQEVFKLIRDALALSPQIVVALNGINDMGFLHCDKTYPMLHPYQKHFFEVIAKKTGQSTFAFNKDKAVAGSNCGVPLDTEPHLLWARNISIMKAVCTEFGIHFKSFLQPVIGIGSYAANEDELAALQEMDERMGRNYIKLMTSFYEEAMKIAAETDHIHDLTEVFADHLGVYSDIRHPNIEGYHIVAKSILAEISDFLP